MTEAEAQAVIDGMVREGTLRIGRRKARDVVVEVVAGPGTVNAYLQAAHVRVELFDDKVAFASWAASTLRAAKERQEELVNLGLGPFKSEQFP